LIFIALVELKGHAEMFRQPLQMSCISLDELGRSVVVFQQGHDLALDEAPRAAEAEVYGEEEGHGRVYDNV
jgi:hypothetical protein